MRLHQEQEAICRRLNDPNGLAISLVNQGLLLAFELSRPEEGLPLAEEAARIATKHGLRALAQQIYDQAGHPTEIADVTGHQNQLPRQRDRRNPQIHRTDPYTTSEQTVSLPVALAWPVRRSDGPPVLDDLGEGRLIFEGPGEPFHPTGHLGIARETPLNICDRCLDCCQPLLDCPIHWHLSLRQQSAYKRPNPMALTAIAAPAGRRR